MSLVKMDLEEVFVMKSYTNSRANYPFTCTFKGINQDTPKTWHLTTTTNNVEKIFPSSEEINGEYYTNWEIIGMCLCLLLFYVHALKVRTGNWEYDPDGTSVYQAQLCFCVLDDAKSYRSSGKNKFTIWQLKICFGSSQPICVKRFLFTCDVVYKEKMKVCDCVFAAMLRFLLRNSLKKSP